MQSSNQICWLGQGVKLAHATAGEGSKHLQEGVAPYFVSQAFTINWHEREERKNCSSCLDLGLS